MTADIITISRMLFLLPLSVGIADVRYGAAIVCMAATVTLIREMTQVLR